MFWYITNKNGFILCEKNSLICTYCIYLLVQIIKSIHGKMLFYFLYLLSLLDLEWLLISGIQELQSVTAISTYSKIESVPKKMRLAPKLFINKNLQL